MYDFRRLASNSLLSRTGNWLSENREFWIDEQAILGSVTAKAGVDPCGDLSLQEIGVFGA